MSQLETNPLNMPTVELDLPNQVMQNKTTRLVKIFDYEGLSIIRDPQQFLNMDQMDWVKLASKNRYYTTISWLSSSIDNFATITFSPRVLENFLPVSRDFNSLYDFSHILITIKPTVNAFYQGLMMVSWDPWPSILSSGLGFLTFKEWNARTAYQLNNLMISPKNSEEIVLVIPINYPFEVFKYLFHIGDQTAGQAALTNYLADYIFGSLRFTVVSPLETNSPDLLLDYSVSIQFLNLKTNGLLVR